MPLPSSPPPLPSPLLLSLLCFCWAMGSAPANPNPPMAVTSAAPLLPVAGEHHLSSLSMSSTSTRTLRAAAPSVAAEVGGVSCFPCLADSRSAAAEQQSFAASRS